MAKHITCYLLLGLLCLVSVAGCGGSHQDIIGKWQVGTQGTSMVWEFFKDGSVAIGSTRGRYSFGDNQRMKIQTGLGTSVYHLELLADRMTLKDPSGSKLEFTRSR